jgi:hypothetical protein
MLDVEPYNPVIFNDPSNTRFVLNSGETIVVGTVIADGRFWMHTDREILDRKSLDQESLADWQFEISELTYKELNKGLEDMLKPVEADVE